MRRDIYVLSLVIISLLLVMYQNNPESSALDKNINTEANIPV